MKVILLLGRRGFALESVAARVCREAGGRVATNILVRDFDLGTPDACDARRLEVVVDGLPLFGGAQFAIDMTLVSAIWATVNPAGLAECFFSHLQGPTPDCPTLCLDVVDKLYDQLLSVLSWHSPRPRMVPRRRQPSWWTHECCSACVRNGAWRDPNPMLHARFRAARLAFHRTVRSARRMYWSQWQSRVTSLSESQPRLAASVIRHTFCGPAHSRGDQSDHVRLFLDGNSCISQQEVLDN